MSGLAVATLYYLLPILRVLGFTLWHRQRPPRHIFNQFSGGQKCACLALIAFGLVYLFNHVYPKIDYYLNTHHVPHHWFSPHSYRDGVVAYRRNCVGIDHCSWIFSPIAVSERVKTS